MVFIEPFEVEGWMDAYENTPDVMNISETCSSSISLDQVIALSRDPKAPHPIDTSTVLSYGPIKGSQTLKERIAAVYETNTSKLPISPDQVLVTQGAISANFITLYTLVGNGDHVICVHPTYSQLYAVPRSLSAEVSFWELKKEKNFVPDVDELERLAKSNTKVIILNNPNNPTGATIPKATLANIVDFARQRNIIIFCDEVYWPLFHSLQNELEAPPSILSFDYDRVVSTGSMSKTYALAGLRLGWIASKDRSIIDLIVNTRHYTTISVSQLDDQVARYALSESVLPSLLKRNLDLARKNLELLDEFVQKHTSVCSWVKPNAGTTAFIQFLKDGNPVNDPEFCLDVLNEIRVLLVPGGLCFGSTRFPGYVRVGYVCHTNILQKALKALDAYLTQKF